MIFLNQDLFTLQMIEIIHHRKIDSISTKNNYWLSLVGQTGIISFPGYDLMICKLIKKNKSNIFNEIFDDDI